MLLFSAFFGIMSSTETTESIMTTRQESTVQPTTTLTITVPTVITAKMATQEVIKETTSRRQLTTTTQAPCHAHAGQFTSASGKCHQCHYPLALKDGACVKCLNTERIVDFACVSCGQYQIASFYQLDCACRLGYPEDRNDATGDLICHKLAFDQVFIASTIQTCQGRQYPSVEKTSCVSCGLGMIPQYSSDTENWFCLLCENYYESNDGLICVDDMCNDGRSVFDLNTKSCVPCAQYEFLNQAGDACEKCQANESLSEDYQCTPCPTDQVAHFGRCFSCNPNEFIQTSDQRRFCSRCPRHSIPSVSRTSCIDCGPDAVVVTQPDGSLTCQPCRGASIRVDDFCQPCQAGQVAIGNVCSECTGASLAADNGTACVECDTNEVAFNNECRHCGEFSIVQQNQCIPCNAGERAVAGVCQTTSTTPFTTTTASQQTMTTVTLANMPISSTGDASTTKTGSTKNAKLVTMSAVAQKMTSTAISTTRSETVVIVNDALVCDTSQIAIGNSCVYCRVNELLLDGNCVPCPTDSVRDNDFNKCIEQTSTDVIYRVVLSTELDASSVDPDIWNRATGGFFMLANNVTDEIEAVIARSEYGLNFREVTVDRFEQDFEQSEMLNADVNFSFLSLVGDQAFVDAINYMASSSNLISTKTYTGWKSEVCQNVTCSVNDVTKTTPRSIQFNSDASLASLLLTLLLTCLFS